MLRNIFKTPGRVEADNLKGLNVRIRLARGKEKEERVEKVRKRENTQSCLKLLVTFLKYCTLSLTRFLM